MRTQTSLQSLYLMAEENPIDSQIVSQMLQADTVGTVMVQNVDNLAAVYETLSDSNYQALILNFSLPDNQDLRHIRKLLADFPALPIVVLSEIDDRDVAMKCLHMGVQDYVSKDQLNAEVLNRIMHYAIERKQISMQHKQALDAADKKNTQLVELARTDVLTKLPNRAYFQEVTKKAIGMATRMNKCFGILYFDMNGFKFVNDNFGHSTGDAVLVKIAQRLMSRLRDGDTVARVGGDEFVVLTGMLEDPVQAYSVARKVNHIINEAMYINDNEFTMTASIGIATFPEVGSVEKLIQCADMAMYEAKASQQHFACFYTKQLEKKYHDQRLMESSLQTAIQQQELHATFQPIFHGKTDSLSVEALCRWSNNTLGQISPDQFIPVAEATKLGDQLTSYMLKQGADFVELCRTQGVVIDKLCINIFGKQFADKRFSSRLLHELETLGIAPKLLCLEISEIQLVENLAACQIQINLLKKQGVRVALDDFGTGPSSVTNLTNLPIDFLKLDRKLTAYVDSNERNQALCDGIIHMAHRLKISVIAEGVERSEEYNVLKHLGCDEFQGHLLGYPMAGNDLLDHWHKSVHLEAKQHHVTH